MHDYNSIDVSQALNKLGIKKGDNIFCHSNTVPLGIPEGALNKKNIYETITKGFSDVLGEEGTIFFPAFTYSFANNNIFHKKLINKNNGILSEMCIKNNNSFRSLDPNFSVVGIGKNCNKFINNLSINSYDEHSFFSRFVKAEGKICNLNLNSVTTFIHYFERVENVIYRFDKTFYGYIKINNKLIKKKSKIFVRKKNNKNFIQYLDYYDYLCKKKGFYKTQKLGNGYVATIKLKNIAKLVKNEISKDHFFLTKLSKRISKKI